MKGYDENCRKPESKLMSINRDQNKIQESKNIIVSKTQQAIRKIPRREFR